MYFYPHQYSVFVAILLDFISWRNAENLKNYIPATLRNSRFSKTNNNQKANFDVAADLWINCVFRRNLSMISRHTRCNFLNIYIIEHCSNKIKLMLLLCSDIRGNVLCKYTFQILIRLIHFGKNFVIKFLWDALTVVRRSLRDFKKSFWKNYEHWKRWFEENKLNFLNKVIKLRQFQTIQIWTFKSGLKLENNLPPNSSPVQISWFTLKYFSI